MAKVSRINKITTAVLVLGFVIVTMVQTSLRSRTEQQGASPPHRPYRFEDEDYIYEDTPYRALRSHAVIANHFKQLLKKEIDDGYLNTGMTNEEGAEKLSTGELPCPDGDDEHVYRLRRVYPCRWNVAK